MATESASEVRKNLSRLLREVYDNNEDLGIELHGQVVATLTTKISSFVEPLRLSFEEAKKEWADVLKAVYIGKARFYFARKNGDDHYKIYLVPNRNFENRFIANWKDQQNRAKLEKQTATHDQYAEIKEIIKGQIEEALADALASIDTKITHTFAKLNREGDLLKTPESGPGR